MSGPMNFKAAELELQLMHPCCRFWHKVLYDIGVVSSKEPFQKLVSQGMILGEVMCFSQWLAGFVSW